MAVPMLRLFWCILLYALIIAKISSYKIFYAEEECRTNGTTLIRLGTGNANSSGILKASRDGRMLPDMNCHIALKAPEYFEIVISLRQINLMPPDSCHNYLELNSSSNIPVRMCGYLYDRKEIQSYFSYGDMDLIFHTESTPNYTSSSQITQFEIIFTAVRPGLQKMCTNEEALCENGRCIWEGLVNDGHNNCGDSSDETTSHVSQENQLSASVTLAVVIPIIVLALGLIVLLMYCFGHRVTEKIERLIRNEERRNEARSALVSTNSQGRRQNYSTVATQPDTGRHGRESYLALRDPVDATAAVHRHPRITFVSERWRNEFSTVNVETGVEREVQLPAYDPPPSYESVATQTNEKY